MICKSQLQSNTLKTYISAIKAVLQDDGYEWNENKFILNALTKSCKLKNDKVRIRLPIKKGLLEIILMQIRHRYSTQPYLESLYLTSFLIMYYGLMRIGEVALSQHVVKAVNIHKAMKVDGEYRILIVLYSSKTHGPESLPQKIKICNKNQLEVIDKDTNTAIQVTSHKPRNQHFCPVFWICKYLNMRPHIRNNNEQFLIFKDGSPVQPNHLRKLLKNIIKNELNLDESLYDTHSFRIGRATDLFKDGTDVERIKKLGRWKSNAVYINI